MERIKHMSLKQSFFFLTMIFLLISLLLSVVSIISISKFLRPYGSSIEFSLNENMLAPSELTVTDSTFSVWYRTLKILQFTIPIIFIIVGLLTADLLFYHIKLKKPLFELQNGAERIMQNDLDFSVTSFSKDELGELCEVFEAMRLELLKNNRELWRQAEERKRLNAAFSHDLRNPVTVLKGSSRMLKKELISVNPYLQSVHDSVSLIEEYTGRIETYVEAMSSVQRLEELQCCAKQVNWEVLTRELSDSIDHLTINKGIEVEKRFQTYLEPVWVDKGILFNVAENLVANAIRYAKRNITILLLIKKDEIILSVRDDGNGFSSVILNKGIKPFLRGEENETHESHFGIGLYVCRLLCEKHRGSLKIENMYEGASVTAFLNSSKS